MEKDIAHKIHEVGMENELDTAKRMIKYMFFQNEKNLERLGKNSDAVRRLTEGKGEREIVVIMLEKIESLYCENKIMNDLITFVREHKKEVFLYLENPKVEKTSDLAEQHFSIQSWLFKHRFKTKDGLLRTSYWYPGTYQPDEKGIIDFLCNRHSFTQGRIEPYIETIRQAFKKSSHANLDFF
jgi:hypothetical protein